MALRMKKNQTPPPLLVEIINRKKEAQKSGASTENFKKFQPSKMRNENRSNVGAHWGPRKGN